MTKHNEENERIKRRYYTYLREAKGRSEASVDAAAAAIDRFEAFLKRRSLKKFHRDRAVAFKRRLWEEHSAVTGQPLSRSTIDGTLRALAAFFRWLAEQPGYRSKFTYSDAEHFHLAMTEVRAGRQRRVRGFPTLQQVHAVIARMPCWTDVERRDQALIALALLTGARDGALLSLRLKHLNMGERVVDQDPREVRTKFSKQITTWFFPVGGDAEAIVADWVQHLQQSLLWGPEDPLFPATLIVPGDRGFAASGLKREFWTTAEPIRRIFRAAFAAAGLPYFHPHSLRHTLSKLGTQCCKTHEELKAWSQNLGHNGVLTTLLSYGEVPAERQGELIRAMSVSGAEPETDPNRKARRVLAEALAKLGG